MGKILLGVNIDHVATLRNARGTHYPEPFEAIALAMAGGADGITIHLREDRRHIIDSDVEKICSEKPLPINLEIAATQEMLAIAIANKPHEVCLVPEKRAELTTEGGLNVIEQQAYLTEYITALHQADILVSMFVDPEPKQILVCSEIGADIVELHTGRYAELEQDDQLAEEINRLLNASLQAHKLGMVVNAGHGLTAENIEKIVNLPHLNCLNIGHAIVSRAVFVGMENAVSEMCDAIKAGLAI